MEFAIAEALVVDHCGLVVVAHGVFVGSADAAMELDALTADEVLGAGHHHLGTGNGQAALQGIA
ncbi:hypothetical protein D3C85_1935780 [compost metagenome]